MPLDPQVAALFPPSEAASAFSTGMLPAMRDTMRAMGDAFSRPDGVVREAHRAGEVPLRLYRPAEVAGDALLVFLHGGGWMFGDLDTHDAMIARIAVEARCGVLAVRYRLAPEHRFPAGLDDGDIGYSWAREHAAALGFDPAKVGLGGESAGANLAAALTLRLRDRGAVQPLFQLLIHPVTDMRLIATSIDAVDGPGLNRAFLEAARDLYLNDIGEVTAPEASPHLATHHGGLAPAIVLTAECDPLRDDGEAYALALAAAGVETLVQRLPGLPHGFLFLPYELDAVARAYRLLGTLIRRYVVPA